VLISHDLKLLYYFFNNDEFNYYEKYDELYDGVQYGEHHVGEYGGVKNNESLCKLELL